MSDRLRSSGLAVTRFHRRRHPRIDLSLPVEYTVDQPPERRLTRLGTLGAGGIMLYLSRSIPVDTEMTLKLHLPGHITITCVARVVWTELLTGSERNDFKTGVRFEQIAEEALEQLRQFIKEQQNPFDDAAALREYLNAETND
jgi:c-di-GMP-binding flagellar brake protein YcgR